MGSFSFYPELLEYQGEVRTLLSDHGYEWFSDYSAVDCLHDVHGLEVCGVREEQVANSMLVILSRRFKSWPYRRLSLKDYGSRDPGWKAVIHRDADSDNDSWMTA